VDELLGLGGIWSPGSLRVLEASREVSVEACLKGYRAPQHLPSRRVIHTTTDPNCFGERLLSLMHGCCPVCMPSYRFNLLGHRWSMC
jgi:hypothetical protein